jgi:large repetitive protein
MTTTLAAGSHTLTARETHPAGNMSGASAPLVLTLDTTIPAVTEALVADTGSSAGDRITSNPAVTGGGDPNAVVTIAEGGTRLGTTMADSFGA